MRNVVKRIVLLPRTRKLAWATAVLAACALSWAITTAAAAPPAKTWSNTVAVIYSHSDELAPAELASVIAGIESNSDVVVYRISLDTVQTTANPKPATPVRVALNSDPSAIAVIYPDIGEPYRSVFSKIIEGIETKTKSRVTSIAVGADVNMQDVANDLRKQNIRVVIALGRHGLKAAATLNRDIGVIAGGVISASDAEARAVTVLSLAPDPAIMFTRLKTFMPGARRVYVVYDPQHNAWLVRLARDAAAALDLELIAVEAPDLKTAVRHYQKILASADPRRDAIWLPQDPTSVEESSVLPLVLEEAWNRSLVVFSSNLAHVRRGALFALYPNNIELGRSLASSALDCLASGDLSARGVSPLRNVLMAVNVRTASHLGIALSSQQQEKFDLVFPQP